MFTDGEPAAGSEAMTVAAFRGYGPTLKLHVVGFGPHLNSGVMRELSANGTNTYINSIATAPIMISSLVAFLIAPKMVLSQSDDATRCIFVKSLSDIIASRSTVADLYARLQSLPQSPFCLALQSDVQSDDIVLGQIEKAVQAPWGPFYLDSILSAHRQMYAMSDLEASLQFYASPEFTVSRDAAMTIMRTTPYAPVMQTDHSAGAKGIFARSSSSYTQDRGGCFTGNSTVTTPLGIVVRIDELCTDDVVVAFNADGSVVEGIVSRVVKYVHGGNIIVYNDFITAYHPILMDGAFVFPIECMDSKSVTQEPVYNILLYPGPVGIEVRFINDRIFGRVNRCLTLAHNIWNDKVASHPYFGTDRIRHDIMMQPCINGRVIAGPPTRDPLTGLVCSMFH